MKPSRTILVALTLAASATLPLTTASSTTRQHDTGVVRSDEISSQRYSERRPVRHYHAPTYNEAPQYYRGSADPSIGPDGRPYRVPEYLRNQCYIDDGYGRFSACSNR
jgi:hypothetical protein